MGDEAVYSEKYGQEFYDRDALTFFDEGTKENPICILSEEPDRLVGVSLTDDANIRCSTSRRARSCATPSPTTTSPCASSAPRTSRSPSMPPRRSEPGSFFRRGTLGKASARWRRPEARCPAGAVVRDCVLSIACADC